MPAHGDTLVDTAAEIESLTALREATGEVDGVMERHTLRCFLLCRLLADKHNADLDREVMLCASILHDIGLYDAVSEGGVYTDEGGEFARKLGLEHGWDERRAGLRATAARTTLRCARSGSRAPRSGAPRRRPHRGVGWASAAASAATRSTASSPRCRATASTAGFPRCLAGASLPPAEDPPDLQPLMGRLDQPQDPLFKRIDASVGFDRRLWPHDITGSIAHARALNRAGVLTGEELDEMVPRTRAGERTELSTETFDFKEVDEDIHMAVERRLTESSDGLGASFHTGRSPQRPVATDLVLFVSLHAERAVERIAALMATLVGVAESHTDWPMPGYTHLQRAQPVYLAHHLLAYFWMLRRDARRFEAARAAALAGDAARIGRTGWAELGPRPRRDRCRPGFRRGSAPNSIDAVSNRDAALDYLSAAAICATHLFAPGVGAGDLVKPGVRLLRARRRLRLRLLDHPPEEKPGRRPSSCAARRRGWRRRSRP